MGEHQRETGDREQNGVARTVEIQIRQNFFFGHSTTEI